MTQKEDQQRHEELQSALAGSELLHSLAIDKRHQTASGGWSEIDTQTLNNGAELLKVYFNLYASSSGTMELYELLQAYFKDDETRIKINAIVKDRLFNGKIRN